MSHLTHHPIRMLLWASDEVVTRPVLRAIEHADDIELVDTTDKGFRAVRAAHEGKVDVVVLDIGRGSGKSEASIHRLKRASDHVRIVMVGSLRFDVVKTSMSQMIDGTAEFIPIPTSYAANNTPTEFASELCRTIRALAEGRSNAAATPHRAFETKDKEVTRAPDIGSYKCLLIGSSTGGPHAVSQLLEGLGSEFPLPVLITQHMPPNFTKLFAENLTRNTAFQVKEAEDGETVTAGCGYVAPGDRHMTVEMSPEGIQLRLIDTPPINYCKPAVDPMFISAAQSLGPAALSVILTGMGTDGTEGAGRIRRAGGYVIVQDEASSVVWGMPGAAFQAGHVDQTLALDHIAPEVLRLVGLKTP